MKFYSNFTRKLYGFHTDCLDFTRKLLECTDFYQILFEYHKREFIDVVYAIKTLTTEKKKVIIRNSKSNDGEE